MIVDLTVEERAAGEFWVVENDDLDKRLVSGPHPTSDAAWEWINRTDRRRKKK